MPSPVDEPPWTACRVHFLIVFLLVSFNLRMSFAAADPLLLYLERDLKLSLTDSGIFAVLPVMVLGVASTLAARLVSVIRPRMVVLIFLAVAVLGVLWRSYGGMVGLFGGMVFIGLGLGVVGSAILGVLKDVFPFRSEMIMGGYTAFVCLGTSVGSGCSLPLASALGGWKPGLAFWAVPLAVTLLLWLGMMHYGKDMGKTTHRRLQASIRPLLGQKKAWTVSIFYLFRVAGAYLLTIWLASLMRRRGMNADESGFVLALATLCQIPSSLLSGKCVQWLGGQARLMFVTIPLSIAACWGLLFGPLSWWPCFSVIFGLCIGFIFTLGMGLIVQRAADEATVVALSGMSQGVGFIAGGLLAWVGNFCVGSPHAELYIAALYTVYGLGGLVFGLLAARPGMVSGAGEKAHGQPQE